MEKNLFQQAKEMMMQFTNTQSEDESTPYKDEDRHAVMQAIQAAYQDATPEEQQQLSQFEQELDKKMQ